MPGPLPGPAAFCVRLWSYSGLCRGWKGTVQYSYVYPLMDTDLPYGTRIIVVEFSFYCFFVRFRFAQCNKKVRYWQVISSCARTSTVQARIGCLRPHVAISADFGCDFGLGFASSSSLFLPVQDSEVTHIYHVRAVQYCKDYFSKNIIIASSLFFTRFGRAETY